LAVARGARDSRLGFEARRCATWCCPAGRRAPEAMGEADLVPLISRDALIAWPSRARPPPERRRLRVRAPAQYRGAPRRAARQRGALPGQLFVCATGCCCGRHRGRLRAGSPPRPSIANGSGGDCAISSTSPSAAAWAPARSPMWRSCSSTARPNGSTRSTRTRSAIALYDHVEPCWTPTPACRRRPRSRRITSPRLPGSRVPTASRWTTHASGAGGQAHACESVPSGWPPRARTSRWTAWSRSMGGPGRSCRARTASWSSREPWQGRVSAWRSRLHEPGLYDWEEFRQTLIARSRPRKLVGGLVELRDL